MRFKHIIEFERGLGIDAGAICESLSGGAVSTGWTGFEKG